MNNRELIHDLRKASANAGAGDELLFMMRAAADALEAMEWKLRDDDLPNEREGEPILGYVPDVEEPIVTHWNIEHQSWVDWGNERVPNFTYWMHSPGPPEVEE